MVLFFGLVFLLLVIFLESNVFLIVFLFSRATKVKFVFYLLSYLSTVRFGFIHFLSLSAILE
ncbi:hypothetical protein CW304_10775 [Bacillus sp. UFRGS-B20]|nr:hypothetical protein CW304_10775 [Bacillus sp. UFRGS-B20]